jgi:hypothetical protein
MIEINHNPSHRDLRQFAGIWFPAFCGVIGAILYFRFRLHTAAIVVWAVAAALGLLGLARPALIKPVFIGLMYLAFPIGYVMSHVLLGVVYYLLITPIALVMKLAGRDTMGRRFDPAATTYWVARKPVAQTDRYFRQY